MKCSLKWFLLLFVLVAALPAVSALSVSTVSVSPSGDFTPGTTVTASFTIDFSTSGDETFPADDYLTLSTDLDNPNWNVVLVLNEIDNPQPVDNAKTIDLSGWVLSYDPDDVEESMRVTLTGTAPSVTSTTEKTIVEVSQLDSNGNLVDEAVTVNRKIVNTGEVTAAIAAEQSSLDELRIAIDEKYALGVDTAAAEQKYSTAQSAITSAKAQPASGYSNAIASLETARQAISDGQKALDRAWAEKKVADAQYPISQTESLITWIRPNATSSEYKSALSEISTQKELATGLVDDANDAINAGNYDNARQKADAAFQKANESYTSALAMKKSMMTGFNPLGMIGGLFKGSTLIIVIVLLVIIGGVGYIIYRKRTQWDELG